MANASGVHAAATAELAVGLILAKLRGIDQAVRDQQHGIWRPERRQSLADRRVLLVGVGGIGHEIARRLEPFEVTVTRVGSSARTDEHGEVHASSELPALAATHDILVSVLPLNEHTHHLIGEEVLAALPDGALVVNVGRGSVVDTAALTKEVLSGRLQVRPRRRGSGAAAAGPPAVVHSQRPDHAARRRQRVGVPAAGSSSSCGSSSKRWQRARPRRTWSRTAPSSRSLPTQRGAAP